MLDPEIYGIYGRSWNLTSFVNQETIQLFKILQTNKTNALVEA